MTVVAEAVSDIPFAIVTGQANPDTFSGNPGTGQANPDTFSKGPVNSSISMSASYVNANSNIGLNNNNNNSDDNNSDSDVQGAVVAAWLLVKGYYNNNNNNDYNIVIFFIVMLMLRICGDDCISCRDFPCDGIY